MSLSDYYHNHQYTISFEVFPPKTDQGVVNLMQELSQLQEFKPTFISVTYGAGGSTRDRTLDLALQIRERFQMDPLVHFTCVGASRSEIGDYLNKVKELGLTHILALRGDPPRGETEFKPAPDGFAHASELTAFIRDFGGFDIAVAGYPEGHPQAPDLHTDIRHLKEKIDAGAELIITQLFFDNEDFLRYRDLLDKEGITVPVVPGILPVTGAAQLDRVNAMSGARIPDPLRQAVQNCPLEDDFCRFSLDYTVDQVSKLMSEGIKGFHFYPLNKAAATSYVLRQAGLVGRGKP